MSCKFTDPSGAQEDILNIPDNKFLLKEDTVSETQELKEFMCNENTGKSMR